ncbi:hypothetical protein B0H15DRAFT_21132 [Mycena belliarum]|uniref:Secreted protein n=1 Tax=Mycena belliarum TaxID=1033014 RepID=A0AAD6UIX5_9AGAR|nr:hypothetical protein B0H15DRAFT_21132 [Mycena belliae]
MMHAAILAVLAIGVTAAPLRVSSLEPVANLHAPGISGEFTAPPWRLAAFVPGASPAPDHLAQRTPSGSRAATSTQTGSVPSAADAPGWKKRVAQY